MPLRNERQAYWDDIEENIARVPALSASAHLARVCPEAAAAQAELRSRLHDLDIDIRACRSHATRSHALSAVAARERDAELAAEEKRVELQRAEAFVRGRLEGDRVQGRRVAFTRPEDLPRAGVGEARRMGALGGPGQADSRLRHHPEVVAQAQREANERWGAAETGGVLMGGGYTFVLERRRRDAEDATRRAEDAARERALYFEPIEPEEEDEDVDGRVGTGKENMDGVGAALKGWGSGSNQTRARGRGVDEESVLPPPRYGFVAPSAASGSRTASEPATSASAASGVDAMGESAYPTSTRGSRQSLASSTRSGYGSQLAMVSHVGGSSVPPPPRPRTRSIIF